MLLIKDCTYKVKKRCKVFGTMCSFLPKSPLSVCGQAPVPKAKKAKKGKK